MMKLPNPSMNTHQAANPESWLAQTPQQLPGMMQQQADPLEQLRDIRQPDPLAETWPAPGWWLLTLLLAAGLVMAVIRLYRYWRSNRYRRESLRELQAIYTHWQRHGNDRQYLHDLQSLLKRTALTGFRREQVAALSGEAWLAFLDESSGTKEFSLADETMVNILIDGSYRADQEARIQVLQLHSLALTWVKRHHPKHLKASPFADDYSRQSSSGQSGPSQSRSRQSRSGQSRSGQNGLSRTRPGQSGFGQSGPSQSRPGQSGPNPLSGTAA